MTIQDINDIIKAVCPNDEDYEKPCISPKYLRQELEQLALEQEQRMVNKSEIPTGSTTDVPGNNVGKIDPTTKNDLALIHTEGLDEEIRCTMCTNSMMSDRGCDGSCVVNKDMYKAVMETIEKRIQPTTKNDLGVDCISRQAVLELIADYDLSMGQVVRGIHALPSVTPQYSSELEKNSKKLEKDFGELDCISRANAIKAMQDKTKKLTNEDTINGLCGAVAILFDLPSVTPQETRKGHWISTETKGVRYAFWCRYKCSLCGGLSDHTNFCPNCGAKMESEDKEQEDDNT